MFAVTSPSDYTTEIWHNDHDVRAFTVFGDGTVRRFWTVRREGNDIATLVRQFTIAGAFEAIYSNSGTERWEKGELTFDQVKTLAGQWRKKCSKTDFRYLGRIRYRGGQVSILDQVSTERKIDAEARLGEAVHSPRDGG